MWEDNQPGIRPDWIETEHECGLGTPIDQNQLRNKTDCPGKQSDPDTLITNNNRRIEDEDVTLTQNAQNRKESSSAVIAETPSFEDKFNL